MAISNQALQKLVEEIEIKAQQAQREINVVKTAVSSKQRDVRLLELTSVELKGLPADTKVYEGVGKMFLASPTADVQKRLGSEAEQLKADVTNLNKKLHYLETTHKNSQTHIERILKAGG